MFQAKKRQTQAVNTKRARHVREQRKTSPIAASNNSRAAKDQRETSAQETVTHRVPLLSSVAIGAVIGKAGCYQKALSSTYQVETRVDTHNRGVFLRGAAEEVRGATNELIRLFETLQVAQTLQIIGSRPEFTGHAKARSGADLSDGDHVHQNSVKCGSASLWCFERRSSTIQDDPNANKFQYVMRRIGQVAATQEEDDPAAWICDFNRAFMDRMVAQIALLSTTSSSSGIKVKASLGRTHFLLRSYRPEMIMSWGEIQRLEVGQEITPCWGNARDRDSIATTALIDKLDSMVPSHVPRPVVLTVFVALGPQKRGLSLKYHFENGHWIPVQRHLRRVVHKVIDVALDESTAFRIRLCSREPALAATTAPVDLHSCLVIRTPLGGSVFESTVELRPDCRLGVRLLSHSLRTKTHVDLSGLRFSLERTGQQADARVRLECRLQRDTSAVAVPLAQVTEQLVLKLLALLGHSI